MEQTGAIIIAAGLSSRMGEFKPMLPISGTSFIKHIIDKIREAGVTTIVIITGYCADDLEAHLLQSNAILVRNERYATSQMLDSVCIGLRVLQEECRKILITPADIPLVSVETYRKILAQESDYVRPVYHGCSGHPVMIHHSMIPFILDYKGSYGLRGAMESSDGSIYSLPVDDPAIYMDADTPEDYSRLLTYQSRHSDQDPEICLEM